MLVKVNRAIAFLIVKVGEPNHTIYKEHFFAINNLITCCIVSNNIIVRDSKPTVATIHRHTKPKLIIFDVRKNLLKCDSILISNYQEFLAVFHKLCDVLTEEGERRVGDNDVGFFKELNTFLATEISVTL